MNKSSKKGNSIYKSFDQWKADFFPNDTNKSERINSQNINDLAVQLADISFNKVLSNSSRSK